MAAKLNEAGNFGAGLGGTDSREDGELAEIELTYSILDDINQARPAFGTPAVCIIQVLDGLDAPKPGNQELLELILSHRLSAEAAQSAREIARQLRELASRLARAPQLARSEQIISMLVALRAQTEQLHVPDDIGKAVLGYIDGLQSLQQVTADPSSAEANISTITRQLYIEAFNESREVPIHLRVSLAPEAAFLRDVELSIRCEHPEMEIVERDRVVKLLRLDGQDPAEVRCRIRLRKGTVPTRTSTGESEPLSFETELGTRQGGTLRLVPFRGKKLSVVTRPEYPYTRRENPYTVGPAVRNIHLIKGRDQETQEIFRTLHGRYQDNVPLIWGARRIGKSTLLYRLKMDADFRRYYEPVICDMERLITVETRTTPRFLYSLARNISEELAGTPAGRLPVPDIQNAQDCLTAFRSYLDKLVAACGDKVLLLMFDEMEFFLGRMAEDAAAGHSSYSEGLHEDIVHTLRHYMQHKKGVSFLLSGTKQLLEMSGRVGERLFHMPLPLKVEELKRAAAIDLITEPVGDSFDYSSSARERLLFLTNGHPYFLQGICYELFRLMQDRRLSVCSVAEINDAVQMRVLNQTTLFSFQYREMERSPETRLAACAIAELTQEERRADLDSIVSRIELLEERACPPEPVRQAAEKLVENEILTQWRGEYRFRIPLMGLYIASRARRAQ